MTNKNKTKPYAEKYTSDKKNNNTQMGSTHTLATRAKRKRNVTKRNLTKRNLTKRNETKENEYNNINSNNNTGRNEPFTRTNHWRSYSHHSRTCKAYISALAFSNSLSASSLPAFSSLSRCLLTVSSCSCSLFRWSAAASPTSFSRSLSAISRAFDHSVGAGGARGQGGGVEKGYRRRILVLPLSITY